MIEILLILHLFRKVSDLAKRKNRNRWLPWTLPVLWIGMQILFASLAYAFNQDNPTFTDFHAYGYALLGGVLGACISFALVLFLPLKSKPLQCPDCGWTFTEHGPIGVECKQCGTWLRVTRGKVYRI